MKDLLYTLMAAHLLKEAGILDEIKSLGGKALETAQSLTPRGALIQEFQNAPKPDPFGASRALLGKEHNPVSWSQILPKMIGGTAGAALTAPLAAIHPSLPILGAGAGSALASLPFAAARRANPITTRSAIGGAAAATLASSLFGGGAGILAHPVASGLMGMMGRIGLSLPAAGRLAATKNKEALKGIIQKAKGGNPFTGMEKYPGRAALTAGALGAGAYGAYRAGKKLKTMVVGKKKEKKKGGTAKPLA